MIVLDAALEFWLHERTPDNRARLVERYRYLCPRAARRFVRPGLERADLEQVAAIGLIKACDRFDAGLQTPFEAFAWVFVLGELMHHVRDYERIVRPPRRLRELEKRWQVANETLTTKFQREPTASELATYLHVSVKEVADVRRYRDCAVAESLDAVPWQNVAASRNAIDERDDLLTIEAALKGLTETERAIVLAVYGRGYSQLELSERMGYSQRHISRLHRAALAKMQPACRVNPTARQRGFTLIEMMIVVAIIAILAAILIPNFTHARQQAATAACEANLKEIATALELYYTDHQSYPIGPKQQITPTTNPLSGYLNQVPEDPAAGAGKYYEFTAASPSATGGIANYQIYCPGTHDPSTLQSVTASTTNAHLQFDSVNGFGTIAAQP